MKVMGAIISCVFDQNLSWQIMESGEDNLPSLQRFPLEVQEVLESGDLVKEIVIMLVIDVLEMTF